MPIDFLTRTYGQRIAETVVRKFQSTSDVKNSNLSDAIVQLTEMAQLCSDTYLGIDFFTRLSCSAMSSGTLFRQVCTALRVSPSALDANERRRIDSTMDILFERAVQHGRAPVPLKTAQTWLRSLIDRSVREINAPEPEHDQQDIVDK